MLCLTILSHSTIGQAPVINFLTNSFLLVACREEIRRKIIKAPMPVLRKRPHAIKAKFYQSLIILYLDFWLALIVYNARPNLINESVGNK